MKLSELENGLDVLGVLDDIEMAKNAKGGGFPEAPTDGNTYGRKNKEWAEVTGGAGEETDPIYSVSEAALLVAGDKSKLDTAYGWGDHDGLYDPIGASDAAVGAHESAYDHDAFLVGADLTPYLTAAAAASTYVPYAGATGSVNLGNYGLTAIDITVTGDNTADRGITLTNGVATARLEVQTNNVTRLGTETNHSFEFITKNTTRFKVYGTGNVEMYYNLAVTGNVTGANLSGTNTGDQDLSGLVPYTGATGSVDLGAQNLTTTGLGTFGSLVVDTTTLVVNASGYTDKVGIGTATPARLFHIAAQTSLTDDQLYAWRFEHTTTGTPVTNFGINYEYYFHNSTNQLVEAAIQQVTWADPTAGGEDIQFNWIGKKAGVRTSLMYLNAQPTSTLLTVVGDATFAAGTSRIITISRNSGTSLQLTASTTASGATIGTTTASPLYLKSNSVNILTLTGGNAYLQADNRKLYFGAGDDVAHYFNGLSYLVTVDGSPFLHNFQHATGSTAVPAGSNTFVGKGAGNLTMGSTATNTAHGSYNVGVGSESLKNITTGYQNVAIGTYALTSITTGRQNVAIGHAALYANQTGSSNMAIGFEALKLATGSSNVAIGRSALAKCSTGISNAAIGQNALSENTTGSLLVGVGGDAGRYIADGSTANQTSSYSVYIGYGTKASADGTSNEIVIGYNAIGAGSNSVVLGNDSIATTLLKGSVKLLADNQKLYFGAGDDAAIYYDGTNLVVNPKEVGSGILDVLGVLQTGGYNSSDGTAGATGTITLASVTTITVKDGLITAWA
jgi:hypothetical protein